MSHAGDLLQVQIKHFLYLMCTSIQIMSDPACSKSHLLLAGVSDETSLMSYAVFFNGI